MNNQHISKFFEEHFDQLIQWRRHLHAHPELSWNEFETTQYLENELRKMGFDHIERITKTGLVAYLNNDFTECLALRADIDALPIIECRDVEYKSLNEGIMHACGHDVHSTCLLGAALYLIKNRDKVKKNIKFIFQPSEEKQPSGAEAMINAGVLKDVQSIIGLHVTPELEVGKLGFRKGQFMASADEIYITVHGKGGHAASPHLCVDPILIASHIIIALQQISSRNANPLTPTVLSIGDIHGFGATNIIPTKVEMKGTLRTFDETWRYEMHDKIFKLCTQIAQSMGGECDVVIPLGYPTVYNDEKFTTSIMNKAIDFLGTSQVVEMSIRMGAEDFSFYSKEIPACFFRLGTGNQVKNTEIPVHNPYFDIDEEALKIGSAAFVRFILD